MRHLRIKSGHFLAERKKVELLKSRLLSNVVDVIFGSLWLIGGDQYSQALVMLDTAIELAFKGELERISPILIADTRNLNLATLKSFLRDSFLQHPAGKNQTIPELDIERTINFQSAFERMVDLYPALSEWRD
jgi:hypothetical protein